MAQAQHVQEFIVGTEFLQFPRSPRWNALDRVLRSSRYHGALACSDDWGRTTYAGDCGRGVIEEAGTPPIRSRVACSPDGRPSTGR